MVKKTQDISQLGALTQYVMIHKHLYTTYFEICVLNGFDDTHYVGSDVYSPLASVSYFSNEIC